jgi:tetratricopeptide (TPR) repeat protein
MHTHAQDLAERHLLRAPALNPNRPAVHNSLAHLAFYSGRTDEALDHLATARRTDPFFEPRWIWSDAVRMAYGARRCAQVLGMNPGFRTGLSLLRDPFRREADRAHIETGMRRAGLPD